MVERGKGTILFTGCAASLNGAAGYSELCCGKFALRALSQCLAREFQPLGVHVAHVIIDGLIGPPPRGGAGSSTGRSWLTSPPSPCVGEQPQRQQSGLGSGDHGSLEEATASTGGGMMMDPDAVAQTYWHLHIQDPTGWTQEIDLRPSPPPSIIIPSPPAGATTRFF